MPRSKCHVCRREMKKGERRKTMTSRADAEQFQLAFPTVPINIGDTVCNGCHRRVYRPRRPAAESQSDAAELSTPSESSTSSGSPATMDVDAFRARHLNVARTNCSCVVSHSLFEYVSTRPQKHLWLFGQSASARMATIFEPYDTTTTMFTIDADKPMSCSTHGNKRSLIIVTRK